LGPYVRGYAHAHYLFSSENQAPKNKYICVFENKVLRRIFGSKREEVVGGWRGRHNEELHNLYASPNIGRVIKLRRMRRAGHVARMEEMRNVYNILIGKSEGRRSLGKHLRSWEDNIRVVLRAVGWEDVVWIHLAQDRDQWRAVVNMVMNLRVP
jgi:hypothetical protein